MNFLTEDEAKTKWCPMFRAAIACSMDGGNQYVTNRDGIETGKSPLFCCIGSACMAWRLSDTWRNARQESLNHPQYTDGMTQLGYCGAFGKPES